MADLIYKHIYKADVSQPLIRRDAGILLGMYDKTANRFGVELYDNGTALTLSGTTVTGYMIRPDGNTVTISGKTSGHQAYVDLTENCYLYDGAFTLTLKVGTQTVLICDGQIAVTRTDKTVNGNEVINTVSDAERLGGKAPEYYIQPRNLLDNSWFANPVNQRGKTTYNAAGYTIDRWRISNKYATVNVNSGYVEFKASGGGAVPRQIISTNADMFGKTYTAAVCTVDGVVKTVSGTLTAEATGNESTWASGTIFTGIVLRIVKSSDVSTISFRLDITDGNSLALKWAALYEGSYTVDTLPPYVPKGYGAELAECYRYFRRFDVLYSFVGSGFISNSGSAAYIALNLGNMSRDVEPTVSGSVHVEVPKNITDNAPVVSAFAVNSVKSGWVRLACTFDAAQTEYSGNPCALAIRTGDYLEISADL